MNNLTLRLTSFDEARDAIMTVRETVFIQEQHVPVELEWDGLDDAAQHVIALIDNQVVGTARMLVDGHIGRMAVLKPWRQQMIGTALLQTLLDYARQAGLQSVFLSAQTSAIPFYEKQGFIASGEIFMDAGIPHKNMALRLNSGD